MTDEAQLNEEQRALMGAAKNEQAKLDLHLSSVGQVSTVRGRLLLDLHKSGLSTRQIARELGVSHSAVARAIRPRAGEPDSE